MKVPRYSKEEMRKKMNSPNRQAERMLDCVYGISRWTNPNRASAIHINNGEGLPLCGGNGRKAFSWEKEKSIPTCKKCIRLQKAIDGNNGRTRL